jgi:hypothetical protein
LRQGGIDAGAVEIATAQDLGEQAHLAAGAGAFAGQARRGRQGGFTGHGGEEIVAQGIDLVGDGFQELRALLRGGGAVRG